MFKRCSLPPSLVCLFCFFLPALKTGNKLKRSRKERKNKQRAIIKMHTTTGNSCKHSDFIKMQNTNLNKRGEKQNRGQRREDYLNLDEWIMFHPDVCKQRVQARPADSVYRNVKSICFPVPVCRPGLAQISAWEACRNFFSGFFTSCVSQRIGGGGAWSHTDAPLLPSTPSRQMRAITQEKVFEVSQLMIWSRSGVYRNSWSRLLAEFHFSTSEEATFWLFHPPGLFFNARHRCSVQEN